MRCCATCKLWVPTKMEVYRPDVQPHEQRAVDTESEMLRATHALCSWPAGSDLMRAAPPWLHRRVGGGDLTKEDEGTDCPAWTAREPINIGSNPYHNIEVVLNNFQMAVVKDLRLEAILDWLARQLDRISKLIERRRL